ncbi:NADH:ubiquinone oxidoreductase [Thoreauomyces humboldtii]|nr:NADH:ubiquinone oxidoreductase [Thoreauomyces humboldtii]
MASESATDPQLQELLHTTRQELEECRLELEEFQKDSKELEAELELELEEVHALNKKLSQENTDLKTKLVTQQAESRSQFNALELELEQLRTSDLHMKEQIRNLEIENAELSQSSRVATSTAEDLQHKCHAFEERVTFLEEEVENKVALETELQHARDELRDLRVDAEISVPQEAPLTGNEGSNTLHSVKSSTILALVDRCTTLEERIRTARDQYKFRKQPSDNRKITPHDTRTEFSDDAPHSSSVGETLAAGSNSTSLKDIPQSQELSNDHASRESDTSPAMVEPVEFSSANTLTEKFSHPEEPHALGSQEIDLHSLIRDQDAAGDRAVLSDLPDHDDPHLKQGSLLRPSSSSDHLLPRIDVVPPEKDADAPQDRSVLLASPEPFERTSPLRSGRMSPCLPMHTNLSDVEMESGDPKSELEGLTSDEDDEVMELPRHPDEDR